MKCFGFWAVTASLTSISLVLGLQLIDEKGARKTYEINLKELAAITKENVNSIAALSSEIRKIRVQLDQKNNDARETPVTNDHIESNDLLTRLETVEGAIERLSKDRSAAGTNQTDNSVEQLTSRMRQSAQIYSYDENQSAIAKSNFEEDSGIPLGNYSSSIEEALQGIQDIEVSGLECRETICKVNYSKAESSEDPAGSDIESDLVDKLSVAANRREVEVRYATESTGNKVMYIQLR